MLVPGGPLIHLPKSPVRHPDYQGGTVVGPHWRLLVSLDYLPYMIEITPFGLLSPCLAKKKIQMRFSQTCLHWPVQT